MYEQPKHNQEQTINKWGGEWRERYMDEFGTIIIELEDEYLLCDQKLADICGWSNIPTDDNNNPYEFCGVVNNKDDNKMIIFYLTRMVSIGKDRTFSTFYRITDDEFEKVKNWISEHFAIINAKQEKIQQIAELFKANNLDDDSIKIQRDKILEEYGIK